MKNPNSKFGIIRTALGCSQEQLAIYLGVSRALLSLVEENRRFLPGDAELRLLKIYQSILQTPPATDPDPVPNTTAAIEDYRRMLQNDITRQRNKLEALTTNRQQALNSLQHVAVLRPLSPATDEGYQLFLNVVEAEAKGRMIGSDTDTIALEGLKLKGLEAAWEAVGG